MHQESSDSTWFYEVLAWFELNRKRVIAGAIGVLAVVVAGYVYDWHRRQTERAAEQALFALKERPGTDAEVERLPASDLLKIVNAHSGTSAAQRALILAAADLFEEQKYPEAKEKFDEFLAKHGSSPLAPIAALGVASSLDAMDKVEEAMSAYQRVINQYPAEPAAARARLHMAIIHEHRNQPEQALRLYDDLNRPATFGTVAMESSRRRERLLLKHPELAATNQPPLTAASGPGQPGQQTNASAVSTGTTQVVSTKQTTNGAASTGGTNAVEKALSPAK